jgi:hypothetical protein
MSISWHLNQSQRSASHSVPISLCVGIGLVDTFPRRRIRAKVDLLRRRFPLGPCLTKGESVDLFVCPPIVEESNGSVSTFQRQERIAGSVVLYAVSYQRNEGY